MRVGLNFGAPGDRVSDEGTLWLDQPDVGGPSQQVAVELHAKQGRRSLETGGAIGGVARCRRRYSPERPSQYIPHSSEAGRFPG